MAEIISINQARLLARTLALRTARFFIIDYIDLVIIADVADKQIKIDAAENALHQIDEALK